jgi:hypothetical protein
LPHSGNPQPSKAMLIFIGKLGLAALSGVIILALL